VKNRRATSGRNRTSAPKRPGTPDRRIRRTKASLHEALIGLAREKPYGSIAVKEILDRANIGRSTFYTHFGDKDELLASGIHEVLRLAHGGPPAASAVDRLLAFSLPLLEHIHAHRLEAARPMPREGRAAMHARLEEALAGELDEALRDATRREPLVVPRDLLARHIAATFVRVLDWWVDSDEPRDGRPALTPADVHARFRALVAPVLAGL
jgi:AcrR family transcriptional regulator